MKPTKSENKTLDVKELGKLVKAKRIILGLTVDEVAEKMGTKKSAVSRYENGVATMNAITFLRMCAVLGIDISFNLEQGV